MKTSVVRGLVVASLAIACTGSEPATHDPVATTRAAAEGDDDGLAAIHVRLADGGDLRLDVRDVGTAFEFHASLDEATVHATVEGPRTEALAFGFDVVLSAVAGASKPGDVKPTESLSISFTKITFRDVKKDGGAAAKDGVAGIATAAAALVGGPEAGDRAAQLLETVGLPNACGAPGAIGIVGLPPANQ
jgi:hypothetical protein